MKYEQEFEKYLEKEKGTSRSTARPMHSRILRITPM